jgi:hypothetical protein
MKSYFVYAAALLMIPMASAQTTPPSAPQEEAPQETMPMGGQATQAEGSEQTSSMQHMAAAMTRMAEMCERMMQMEMAAMPYKKAGGILLGGLLTIVLALLAILEVQWIIYWRRLLKRPAPG